MKYKAEIIKYEPKAKKMAEAIENKANEMAEQGYELVTVSVTNSAKAVVVFKCPDDQETKTDEQ